SVSDAQDGLLHRSPFAPASGNGGGAVDVFVRGVVTQKFLLRTAAGANSYGIFLQNTLATDDDNVLTSDGVFVFMGSFPDILRLSGGPAYLPVVGDEVVLRARVTEFFFLTELTSVRLVGVVRSGVDLDTETPAVIADPPATLGDANRFWERREGMRFRIEAGSVVTAPRDVFGSTLDAEFWFITPDNDLLDRADPYARRIFRDPHPLDDIGGMLFDNGNGARTMVQSHGLKAAAADNTVVISPARVNDVLDADLVGALYFAFGKYGVEAGAQPSLTPGADPSLNAPPSPAVDGEEFSTSDYNVENLYDFRDDPNDGCDFTGNAGCPGVNPPFDFVPGSLADYQLHLDDLAAQIVNSLHAPDLLMIQEAEDQDICEVVAGAMVCGAADDRDGKPDTLQELALVIEEIGGPVYDTAYDRDGADDRGIVSAFMFRIDSVELLAADADDPVLGDDPTVDYPDGLAYNTDVSNPKVLNAELPADTDTSTGVDGDDVYTRAPQVGHFRIWRDGIGDSVFTELWAISNHFSSTPNARVGQRTEQAAYQVAIMDAIVDGDPSARFVTGGDFNVYPRPDDPFAPGQTWGCCGVGQSDQLGPMYDAGLHNLWDSLVADSPVSADSYVFQGQAQTLDMQWANDEQFADLVQVRAGHFNADFPAKYAGDVARAASD
ncbi:MAG: lamin tail domain-containing protein, partial [Gammaproteobacteria bacterium]